AERAAREGDFHRAITGLAAAEQRAGLADRLRLDLDGARDEREHARTQVARLESVVAGFDERMALQADAFDARLAAQVEAADARLIELREAKEVLAGQFGEVANKLLGDAQRQFLERADARFRQSEETAGAGLKALLQPVNERLQRYEEGVAKVEAERRDAFGNLAGLIDSMRIGQEKVSSEAAKLVNSLRNAPKSRGRWGEQQLRNVLETCGLAEHTDFRMEVSVADGEGGRLRPDAVVKVPGGKSLIIDAKVSLNAYQDAFGAVDERERHTGLAAHAASMRAHVNGLGSKSYWTQFEDSPEYVVMFVPGEHFLSAALEHDPTLWDFAFDRRVLLATPTNLIAIARTVSAVWRQEKLADQAREIAGLGKELYARLSVMGGHVNRLGKNLESAVSAYGSFVGSLESNVLTSARRFEALNIDTGGKVIEVPPVVESAIRPLTKLTAAE
ncbi:DNA recombination protein RmuC, partial [Sphingomonas bacterium]|uniref:DNA recombination protein RmuC n=1 Tax=Sphingomonas bacterium TaxID=1895847 RepID=UPI0020C66950